MADEYEAVEILCLSCNNNFLFTTGEQKFYEAKGLAHRPKRCRSCRFARKGAKARAPAGAPRAISRPPARAKYSLPVRTFPGLVLEANRERFVAAVDDGKILQVRSGRLPAPGSYVSFTRSTIQGDFHLHETFGATQPEGKDCVRMRASVTEVKDDRVTLRVHFNNARIECSAPSFTLALDQRVLFEPVWSGDGVKAKLITGVDVSTRAVPRASAWEPRSVAYGGGEFELLSPDSSSTLASVLGFTHDLSCPPELTSANYGFFDGNVRAAPRLSLLRMEELAKPGTFEVPGSSSPHHGQEAEPLVAPTYLLRGTRSTGHLLADYLRRNFDEINSLGLERKVVLLYPVDDGTTPENFYGTTSSKLFQSRLLPIVKIEVLANPVTFAHYTLPSQMATGKLTSRRMVAVHYELSASASLSPLPPVTVLEAGMSIAYPARDSSEVHFDLQANLASSVRFSVPKDTLDPEAIREALPNGTLLHTVGHSMAASYTTFKAVFANAAQAERFVGIIGDSNRSNLTGSQWLAAPCSEFWGGANVFTIFTSKGFSKDAFYRLFQANWAFAVNHTQVRFCTDLPLSEICAIADRINSTKGKRMSFIRMYGDGKGFISFSRRSRTSPFFPDEVAPLPELKADDEHSDGPLSVYLHNVPLSFSSRDIGSLAHQLAPGASPVSISQASSSLTVQLAVEEDEQRGSLLAQPCRRLGKHYLFLSHYGLESKQATTSFICSGEEDMPSFPQVLSPNPTKEPSAAAQTEAAGSRMEGSPEVPPGSAPESKSESPSPQELPSQSVRTEFYLRLKRYLPSEATDRMDLVDDYLSDFPEDSLSDFLRDRDSLRGLAQEILEFVREELRNGMDSSDRGGYQQDSTLPPGDFVPDPLEEVGGYNFSGVARTSNRETSPGSARHFKRPKKQ